MYCRGAEHAESYRYTAGGKRLWKQDPSGTTTAYFYGVDGLKLGTYTVVGSSFTTTHTNVYFAGKLIWAEGSVAATDRLGSVLSGGRKYFPYGEEYTTTTQNRTKFATYLRDATTALDYGDQRYYMRTIGRFVTPDPYRSSGGPGDPQSWNRYAYVTNDPVNFLDPSGLDECPAGACFTVTVTAYAYVDLSYFNYIGLGLSIYDITGRPAEQRRSTGGTGAPAPSRVDVATNSTARSLFKGAIAKMRSTRCNDLFPLDSLLAAAQAVDFYDARPDAQFATATQDYVSGNGNQTSLENTGAYGDWADVLQKQLDGGRIQYLPKVVLLPNWWSDGMNPFTLVHEVLHYALGAGDDALMLSFQDMYGFVPKTGSSGDITNWLQGGCPRTIPRRGNNGQRIPRPGGSVGRYQ